MLKTVYLFRPSSLCTLKNNQHDHFHMSKLPVSVYTDMGYVHTHTHTKVYMFVCLYMCVYISIYVCMHVCV